MRLATPLALLLLAMPAPAYASAVNNYNPTEGYLATGIDQGKRLIDLHVTAQTPTSPGAGTSLFPSVGFDMGLGHGWELGLTTQLNQTAIGTPDFASSVDQISAYLHGGVARLSDTVQLGLVVGTNAPAHGGAPFQLGAEGILEWDVAGAAIGFNTGYLRDFTANQGQLYENVNIGGTLGAFQPYAEVGVNIYPDGRPTDEVLRGDLGYSVTDRFIADANLALFFPGLAWGPSVGFTYYF